MKKIYYIITSGFAIFGLILLGMLSGCDNVNDQFDQEYLDSLKGFYNVVNYNYTLTDANYATMGSAIQKPTADSIALVKAALATATNHADSTALLDSIVKLQNRTLYVYGNTIKTYKYFTKTIKFDTLVPLILKKKFPYADETNAETSVIMVTYNHFEDYDTTALSSSNKYTLLTADYDAMGTGSNQPGQNDYFSSAVDPSFYLPIWVKIKYPYAVTGETRLIRYKYYASSATTQQKIVLVYDGTSWKKFATTTQQVAKFKLMSGAWKYINTDILVGLNSSYLASSNLGDFVAKSVTGDQIWSWNSGYKYETITGYASSSYWDNDDWLISPAMNLTDRGDSTFLSFAHTGKYFGNPTKITDKVSVWISTTSDGTSENFNAAQWTQLPINKFPTGNDWIFVNANIKLSAYKGMDNVRIAFRYVSLNADGFAGTYELKNVYVYEKQ